MCESGVWSLVSVGLAARPSLRVRAGVIAGPRRDDGFEGPAQFVVAPLPQEFCQGSLHLGNGLLGDPRVLAPTPRQVDALGAAVVGSGRRCR